MPTPRTGTGNNSLDTTIRITRTGIRRLAAALTTGCAIAALTSCGSDHREETPVTTNASAHQRIIALLQRTADALPWPAATLSRSLPGVAAAPLSATAAPCDVDDGNPEQPYSWRYGLWLLLPAGKSADTAFTELETAWQKQSFIVDKDADQRYLRARESGGYTLSAQINSSGDIPVSVQSPCFPKSQVDRSMSWPETVVGDDHS